MLPSLYIAHGGGPCFFTEWPGDPFARLEAHLKALRSSLPEVPRAVLVISAHWEAARPTVTTHPQPSLIYDFTGFPAHTYQLKYDAPGAPALAARVRELLTRAGIASDENSQRGFDHGVWVPLKVIYPEARVPVVALSLQHGYDPATHLAIGAALQLLRHEGVLILASGMSYHNLDELFDGTDDGSAALDTWLNDAVTGDPARRAALLTRWLDAPSARLAHPEEDHLAPLFVAVGAAGDEPGVRDYRDLIYGKALPGFRFTNQGR